MLQISSLVMMCCSIGAFFPQFAEKALPLSLPCCSPPLFPFVFSHGSSLSPTSFCWFFLPSFVSRTVNGVSCLFHLLTWISVQQLFSFAFQKNKPQHLSWSHYHLIRCNCHATNLCYLIRQYAPRNTYPQPLEKV